MENSIKKMLRLTDKYLTIQSGAISSFLFDLWFYNERLRRENSYCQKCQEK